MVTATAINYMNGGEFRAKEADGTKKKGLKSFTCFKYLDTKGWVAAIIFGLIVMVSTSALSLCEGRLNEGDLTLSWTFFIFFILIMPVPAAYYVWQLYEGENFMGNFGKPILPLIIVDVPIFWGACASSGYIVSCYESTRFYAVVTDALILFPWITLVGVLCIVFLGRWQYFLSDYCKSEPYNQQYDDGVSESKRHNKWGRHWTVFGAFMMVLIILIGVVFANVGKDNIPKDPSSSQLPSGSLTLNTPVTGAGDGADEKGKDDLSEKPIKGWAVYSCQDAKTKPDEYGVNPDPKNEWESGEEAWEKLKTVSRGDPLIGVSTIYYNDCSTGNRYLTEFYNKFSDDTDAINSAIYYYAHYGDNKYNNKNYVELLDEVFSWIEDHDPKFEIMTGYQLKEAGILVKDQLYANKRSHMKDEQGLEVANAIVYDCGAAKLSERYLVCTYKIKNRKIIEIWHIACCFQPCNVSKIMRVTVQPRPEDNKGGSDIDPVNPEPVTEPETTDINSVNPNYDKDASKGERDKGNNPGDGTGEESSDGYDAQKSKKQEQNNYSSIQGHDQIVNDYKQENDNHKGAGDSNTPSIDGRKDFTDNDTTGRTDITPVNPERDKNVTDEENGEW